MGVKLHSPPRTDTNRGQPRGRQEGRVTGAQGRCTAAVGHQDGHLPRGNPGDVRRAGQPALGTGARQRWRAARARLPSNRRAGTAKPSEAPPSHTWRGLVLFCSSGRVLPAATRREVPQASTQSPPPSHPTRCAARGVYAKWQGAHWVLAALADLGYPPGDPALHPLREQVLGTWLDQSYYVEFEATAKSAAYRRRGVPIMRGRYRRCASQQGNALWFLIMLGLADSRCGDLVERLLLWQWPDGGWNCDKNPAADTSSFCETLLPMKGRRTRQQMPLPLPLVGPLRFCSPAASPTASVPAP